jgi:hypothetical protein
MSLNVPTEIFMDASSLGELGAIVEHNESALGATPLNYQPIAQNVSSHENAEIILEPSPDAKRAVADFNEKQLAHEQPKAKAKHGRPSEALAKSQDRALRQHNALMAGFGSHRRHDTGLKSLSAGMNAKMPIAVAKPQPAARAAKPAAQISLPPTKTMKVSSLKIAPPSAAGYKRRFEELCQGTGMNIDPMMNYA